MELLGFKPKYITFDCYGTLTNFQMNDTVRPLVDGVIPPEQTDRFLKDFRAYRIDEVLGEFKLYPLVLRDSWQRVCNRWRIQFKPSDVDAIIAASGRGAHTPTYPNRWRSWPRIIRW